MKAAGLTASNREVVARLRRAFPGPFTASEAVDATGLEPARAARLLRHLVSQGWLTRIQRGMYAAVPLEAEHPNEWRVDPWTIAAVAFAPCYAGGWTALHHWDLTDQLFSTTVVITARTVARREREVGGARFELRHRAATALFGTRRVWRDGLPVDVSDPERTLVDCLDDPSLGGGARHITEALANWYAAPHADTRRLVEHGDRLGNRTVFKRLGFLLEELGVDNAELIEVCSARISAGVSLLDPDRRATGPITPRWNLRINAGVEQ